RQNGDEARGAHGRRAEEQQQNRLRAAVRRRRRHDPLLELARLALAAAEQQHDRRDQPVDRLPHDFSLLPITTQVPTSTNAATSQATIPSGTGPISPSAQPPRSSGCLAYSM